MKKIFLILGGMICSLIIFAVPVFTVLSFIFGWDVSPFLVIILSFEVIMTGLYISWKVEEGEL